LNYACRLRAARGGAPELTKEPMAYTRGRCTNFDYCTLADARRDVEVLVGQEFVCPECGKALRAPPVRNDGTGLAVAAMIGLGALTMISGALYLGIRLGETGRFGAPRARPVVPPAVPIATPAVVLAPTTSLAPAPKPAQPQPQPPPQILAETTLVRIAGSPEMAQLVSALAASYLLQIGDQNVNTVPGPHPGQTTISGLRGDHRELIRVTANGADDGFKSLAARDAELVMAARRVRAPEREMLASLASNEAASEDVVALDGLAVVVNQANPAKSLLMDQVRRVFDGNVQDWLAVGGGAGRIHIYTIRSPSDVRDGFAALAKIGDQDAPNAHPQPDMAGVVAGVAADQNGIGVVDLPHIGPLHALALVSPPSGPLAPTNPLALLLADYPLTYPLYFYRPGSGDDGIPEHFVAFALSADGQKVVTQLGLVSPFMAPPTVPLGDGASDRLRGFIGGGHRFALDFRFTGNSNQLDEAAQRDIDRLASLLQTHHVSGGRLVVAGFGDNRLGPRANLATSRARAEAVAAALAQHGLKPARVGGFGADMPVADNDTDDGAALNRRVEVFLLP